MKRIFLIMIFAVLVNASFAQTADEGKGRPDIPGILQMDYGFNIPVSGDMSTRSFGSRALNFYYLQSLRLGESKFSLHAGIGVAIDRYKLDVDSLNRPFTVMHSPDSAYYQALEGLDISKSFFMTSYLEVPIEFRFNTNPSDVSRSFTVAVGGKVGMLLGGKSKYKYNVDTENHKIEEHHPFHLNRIRYGAYLRVGGGGFNVYANYMISPIFIEDEGPKGGDINTLTVGLSLNLF